MDQNTSKTVLITGGTGFLGQRIIDILSRKGYRIIVLSREERPATDKVFFSKWDVPNGYMDDDALMQADYILHLAGAGIMDQKWTKKYKAEILNSRVASAQLIVDRLRNLRHHVQAIISTSATGYYGESLANTAFTEDDKPGNDFLAEVCVQWENAVMQAQALGIRVVCLRLGILLGPEAGFYERMKKPVMGFIFPVAGSGRQVMPWVHVEDAARAYIFAMENAQVQGAYNVVSESMEPLKIFMQKMSRFHKGTSFTMRAPAFLLKLFLGERSTELLKNVVVSNDAFRQAGFTFIYPDSTYALATLAQESGAG